MPWWDDDSSSGWSEKDVQKAVDTATYAKNTSAAKPSKQEMEDAWNANRGDPAKVYELMQQNNVGVNEVAGMLGVNNNVVAQYLNTGRKRGILQTGSGDDLDFVDDNRYAEVHPESETKDEFMKRVEPWMLDENGKFKGPSAGVNYRYEGMTPDQVYDPGTARPTSATPDDMRDDGTFDTAAIAQRNPALDSYAYLAETRGGTYGGGGSTAMPGSWEPINLKWEPGPDNGGGVLGGIGRAIGNTATGIVNNPALMAALTAGVGSAMSAPGAGATAGGVETGGSAGIGSGTTLGSGSASVSPGIIQSAMSSPYAKPLMNAGKTLVSGGSPTDAMKSAVGTYVGGEVSDALGDGTVGQVGGILASSAVTGRNPLNTLVTAGANAAAGEITGNVPGFSDLSQSQQNFVTRFVSTALQGKNPTQGLINQVTRMALGEVSKIKPKAKSGGWA